MNSVVKHPTVIDDRIYYVKRVIVFTLQTGFKNSILSLLISGCRT